MNFRQLAHESVLRYAVSPLVRRGTDRLLQAVRSFHLTVESQPLEPIIQARKVLGTQVAFK